MIFDMDETLIHRLTPQDEGCIPDVKIRVKSEADNSLVNVSNILIGYVVINILKIS